MTSNALPSGVKLDPLALFRKNGSCFVGIYVVTENFRRPPRPCQAFRAARRPCGTVPSTRQSADRSQICLDLAARTVKQRGSVPSRGCVAVAASTRDVVYQPCRCAPHHPTIAPTFCSFSASHSFFLSRRKSMFAAYDLENRSSAVTADTVRRLGYRPSRRVQIETVGRSRRRRHRGGTVEQDRARDERAAARAQFREPEPEPAAVAVAAPPAAPACSGHNDLSA